MNMIVMLIIFTIIGFASIIIMCAFKGKMPPRVWNIAFIAADLVAFFFWNLASYDRGWLGEGWMTLENISPLCCTLVPLTLFMNDKVKSYVYSLIAFLSVGLFAAMLLSPEYAYFFGYNIEADPYYTSEAACHLICSLFGVYLVLSGQVKPDFKSWVRSLACCFSIVGFGVFLNFFFHRTYFGMDPYGESTIYMLDLFDTHELTLLAYVMGVTVVLTVGMQVMRFLDVTTDLFNQDTRIKDGIVLAYHRIFDDDRDGGDVSASDDRGAPPAPALPTGACSEEGKPCGSHSGKDAPDRPYDTGIDTAVDRPYDTGTNADATRDELIGACPETDVTDARKVGDGEAANASMCDARANGGKVIGIE